MKNRIAFSKFIIKSCSIVTVINVALALILFLYSPQWIILAPLFIVAIGVAGVFIGVSHRHKHIKVNFLDYNIHLEDTGYIEDDKFHITQEPGLELLFRFIMYQPIDWNGTLGKSHVSFATDVETIWECETTTDYHWVSGNRVVDHEVIYITGTYKPNAKLIAKIKAELNKAVETNA